MSSSLLLKNGIALIHDENDKVTATRTDILVQGNIIARIEPNIEVRADTDIIDCTNKIISPGFVDGHSHVWQTFNKGHHANSSLVEFMAPGSFTSNIHSRREIFWAQLGGCLNLLNAGTTTVVDHATINVSPGSSEVALSATVSSGIRSLFCYSPTPIIKSWSPLEFHPTLLEPWVTSDLASLIQKAPFERVRLGLGFEGWHLAPEITHPFFETARKGGIDIITTHFFEGAVYPYPGVLEKIEDSGVMDNFRVILSHGNGISTQQAETFVKNNVYIVSTPSTELQMGHGRPVCFDEEIRAYSCLGGDGLSNSGFSIPEEMRVGLQVERGLRNQKIIDRGKGIKHVHRTVEQAFNLGTIQGARAIGMKEQIGSIAVGKLADLVVFDGDTPAMICAAQNNPVAAVVLFSAPSDISVVIVDGVVRKSEGKLRSVKVEAGVAKDIAGRDILEWKDVVKHILEGRDRYWNDKFSKIDFKSTAEILTKAWGLEEKLTDDIENEA